MFTISVKRKNPGILSKIGRSISGPTQVKVGLVAGATDSNEIMKGVWNEFGTRGGASGGGWGGPIPERPFLRNAMRDNQRKYRSLMIASAKRLLHAETSLKTALQVLGNEAQDDVKDSISSLSGPPNSPVTIELKGSSKPLVDTGAMRDAIRWEIIS